MNKILIIGFTCVCLGGCFVDQGIKMSNEVGKETLTGKNAIENYEWFKTMESGIRKKYKQEQIAQKSIDSFIAMLSPNKSDWTAEDKGEIQRLRMVRDGISYSTNNMIADYEARCNMVNRNLFKDQLPTNIFRGVNGAVEFKYGKSFDMKDN